MRCPISTGFPVRVHAKVNRPGFLPESSNRGTSMGRVEGKVALITGAARGQGRSHAVRLAQEGADIIAVDFCDPLDTVPYPLATADDPRETVKQVENLDRRIVSRQADVRDLAALEQVVAEGIAELGRLDIVCTNAGILSFAPCWELTERQWQDMLGIYLTGVWKTVKAAIPPMIQQRSGGSIILTSSVFGLIGAVNVGQYASASHCLEPDSKSVRAANHIKTLRRDLHKLAQATGVSHLALITPGMIEVLDQQPHARSLAEVYGYDPRLGTPSGPDRKVIDELMVPAS
jgi:NAD(P)-dependent dehydrogenase (short-subunit alcohol dehydrogenase family)